MTMLAPCAKRESCPSPSTLQPPFNAPWTSWPRSRSLPSSSTLHGLQNVSGPMGISSQGIASPSPSSRIRMQAHCSPCGVGPVRKVASSLPGVLQRARGRGVARLLDCSHRRLLLGKSPTVPEARGITHVLSDRTCLVNLVVSTWSSLDHDSQCWVDHWRRAWPWTVPCASIRVAEPAESALDLLAWTVFQLLLAGKAASPSIDRDRVRHAYQT